MAIYANPDYWEQDERGHIDHVLTAVKYVGPSRFYSNNSASTQGRWPTRGNFLHGIWYVAMVPESVPEGVSGEGVAWFERNDAFEVEFEPAAIARALIEDNAGELAPGGPIGDGDSLPGFEERVREALGLVDEIEAGTTYDEQLRELAGLTDAPDEAEEATGAEYLVEEYGRDELKAAVKAVRESTDEFSLRGKSMRDMADYLVESTDDAEAAVKEARG